MFDGAGQGRGLRSGIAEQKDLKKCTELTRQFD